LRQSGRLLVVETTKFSMLVFCGDMFNAVIALDFLIVALSRKDVPRALCRRPTKVCACGLIPCGSGKQAVARDGSERKHWPVSPKWFDLSSGNK
jgi:hypothetical protein